MSERGSLARALWRTALPLLCAGAVVTALAFLAEPLFAQGYTPREYGDFPIIGSRAAVWIAAQLHLFFAAFVLGVPMFAVVAELVGMLNKEERFDKLAKEFTRLLLVSYSATAIWGAVLVFALITLYPRVWGYLAEVFAPSMWVYVGVFFFESFTLYLYYYGWDHLKKGRAKWVHWGLGILLNLWGTIVMVIANSWLTYMMSCGGHPRHRARHGPVLERVRQRHVDADQRAQVHRQHCFWGRDRRCLCRFPVPVGQDR